MPISRCRCYFSKLMMSESFFPKADLELGETFTRQGYVILPVDDRSQLDRLRDAVAAIAAEQLDQPLPQDSGKFLDGIAGEIEISALNDFRLAIINAMNGLDWLRPSYYGLARRTLDVLVGNELAMQRRINMSIQLPNDDSSLLPVHADVWSGDSPFEVVVWLPLVNCYATKSMYILPPKQNAAIQASADTFDGKSAEELFGAIEDEVIYLDVPYGSALVFSQNLLHGNRINREPETRWSMNCRFKTVFSPYADKKLGEFFEPITLRPATRMGLDYKLPGGFRG